MRLIDADKLEKEMLEKCVGDCGCCNIKKCPALNQPTAYDDMEVKEALEKQIPKKVIRKDIREYARFYCLNNHFIFEEHCKIFDLNKHDFSKSGYCECCGQKLDWSEWE